MSGVVLDAAFKQRQVGRVCITDRLVITISSDEREVKKGCQTLDVFSLVHEEKVGQTVIVFVLKEDEPGFGAKGVHYCSCKVLEALRTATRTVLVRAGGVRMRGVSDCFWRISSLYVS
jgi:hypothetical protein